MRRLGVFGGTFDPVHEGHIRGCLAALATFRFDTLLLLPAGCPPHKQGERVTSYPHRFAMLVLATLSYPDLLVSDLEHGDDAPSFTFDTLSRLRESYPGDELYFLMGSDSFAQITTWHRWEELVELAHIVVLHRAEVWGDAMMAAVPAWLRERAVEAAAGGDPPRPAEGRPLVYLLQHEPVVTSATRVRERLRLRLPVDEALAPEVRRYIAKTGLYRGGDAGYDGS